MCLSSRQGLFRCLVSMVGRPGGRGRERDLRRRQATRCLFTSSKQESALWKAAMEKYHGANIVTITAITTSNHHHRHHHYHILPSSSPSSPSSPPSPPFPLSPPMPPPPRSSSTTTTTTTTPPPPTTTTTTTTTTAKRLGPSCLCALGPVCYELKASGFSPPRPLLFRDFGSPVLWAPGLSLLPPCTSGVQGFYSRAIADRASDLLDIAHTCCDGCFWKSHVYFWGRSRASPTLAGGGR